MSTNGTYKFVALLNKTLEPGVALDALGHMALGLSAALASEQREAMQLLEFVDGDGQSHSHISALSLIVLRGTSGNVALSETLLAGPAFHALTSPKR